MRAVCVDISCAIALVRSSDSYKLYTVLRGIDTARTREYGLIALWCVGPFLGVCIARWIRMREELAFG